MKVYVYTDGSYNSGIYAGAFLVYIGTRCIYQNSGSDSGPAAEMHNVAGELTAVMRAAKWLRAHDYTATIVYDYEGVEKWLTGAWKAKNKYTQAYVKFMKPYLPYLSFKWVKGHNGDLGNIAADNLARKALYSKKGWE